MTGAAQFSALALADGALGMARGKRDFLATHGRRRGEMFVMIESRNAAMLEQMADEYRAIAEAEAGHE